MGIVSFAAALILATFVVAAPGGVTQEDEPGDARVQTRKGSTAARNKRQPRVTKTTTVPKIEQPVEKQTVTSAPWLPTPAVAQERELPARSKLAPTIALGLSVVAGIVGAVFIARTIDAIEETPDTLGLGLGTDIPQGVDLGSVPDIEAVKDQQQKVLTNAVAGTVITSAAVAGIVTSGVLLLSD